MGYSRSGVCVCVCLCLFRCVCFTADKRDESSQVSLSLPLSSAGRWRRGVTGSQGHQSDPACTLSLLHDITTFSHCPPGGTHTETRWPRTRNVAKERIPTGESVGEPSRKRGARDTEKETETDRHTQRQRYRQREEDTKRDREIKSLG